jgi:hypothetical protein
MTKTTLFSKSKFFPVPYKEMQGNNRRPVELPQFVRAASIYQSLGLAQ